MRTTQYFYNHTTIDGHSFEYTARPIDILKGRVIALVLFGAFVLAGEFVPLLQVGFILAFVVLVPFVVISSLRYRLRNTRHRNLAFDFKGTYAEAFKAYALWPLLTVPTLGLALPYAIYRQKKFVVNGCRYGATAFEWKATSAQSYRSLMPIIGLGILGVLLLLIGAVVGYFMLGPEAVAAAFANMNTENPETELTGRAALFAMLLSIGIFALYALFGVLAFKWMANVRNLVYNHTELDSVRLSSSVRGRHLVLLWLTNILALIASLGFALPWVKVRMARYFAKRTGVTLTGDESRFLRSTVSETSAFGEELGEVLAIDIGI